MPDNAKETDEPLDVRTIRHLVRLMKRYDLTAIDFIEGETKIRLRRRGTDFRRYLVGDGPLRQSLVARAAADGLSGSVSFVGSLPPDRLPDWYRAADLTVLSSHSEGIPNVLRESPTAGFISSRCLYKSCCICGSDGCSRYCNPSYILLSKLASCLLDWSSHSHCRRYCSDTPSRNS